MGPERLSKARRDSLRFCPQAAERIGAKGRFPFAAHQGCRAQCVGGLRDGAKGRRYPHGSRSRTGADRAALSRIRQSGLSCAGGRLSRYRSGNAHHEGSRSRYGFLGFLVFSDAVKAGVADAIRDLKQLGISLKIISGDNRRVAAYVSAEVGLSHTNIMSGTELRETGNEALLVLVRDVDVFVEVEPNQKERIIMALKKAGNVVGFMGDGINDASALHAADVGISVDSAVDVAKEAADIVLLEKNLEVLVDGVQEGRTTFANTLKYVFMATSANFGNMFSMAGASLFLPFLPLLPKQILLTNLLTDLPEMAIATDRVDEEMIQEPRRWDIKFIRRFMITFGVVSSFFDFLTFGALLFLLHANVDHFRTGWFVESVVSASLIVLIIRTRQPFFKSKPGTPLWVATALVVLGTMLLPYTGLDRLFGFAPMPSEFLLVLVGILFLYVFAAEFAKKLFYRRY